MEPHDITIEILKSIRDEVRQTNSRLDEVRDELSGRISETNVRLDEMREELSARIVESELRTATAITELAGSVREMTGVLKASTELRPRVERCEQDIAAIRAQLASR
ncbi:MAG: hypothetical protein KC776_25545 [Myxococcales bacterium]|nr:hypothetical protein [Myxococcales bacterium]MCB9582202.1 hypothetical protein [Polyangiaceae bacterium]